MGLVGSGKSRNGREDEAESGGRVRGGIVRVGGGGGGAGAAYGRAGAGEGGGSGGGGGGGSGGGRCSGAGRRVSSTTPVPLYGPL